MWGDDKVGAGGKGVPVQSQNLTIARNMIAKQSSPADSMLAHLPVSTVFAVEYLVRVIDISFKPFGNHPLRIVRPCWRSREETTRQHLSSVFEDGLTPPFEFFVLSWG